MIELPGIGRLTGMITSLESIERLFLFHFFDATAAALENGQ